VADIDPVAGMNANRFARRGAGGRDSYGFLYLTWAGLVHTGRAAAALVTTSTLQMLLNKYVGYPSPVWDIPAASGLNLRPGGVSGHLFAHCLLHRRRC
jgi:hypothetical protein